MNIPISQEETKMGVADEQAMPISTGNYRNQLHRLNESKHDQKDSTVVIPLNNEVDATVTLINATYETGHIVHSHSNSSQNN